MDEFKKHTCKERGCGCIDCRKEAGFNRKSIRRAARARLREDTRKQVEEYFDEQYRNYLDLLDFEEEEARWASYDEELYHQMDMTPEFS